MFLNVAYVFRNNFYCFIELILFILISGYSFILLNLSFRYIMFLH
uniref:Uncharacterized protein n=1 Tax=Siphoviridae sp. ctiOl67 TaxID=2825622 RepID=A0A8S5QIZ3_9CAUD|nr:MAG TPA: hypothetical protein [Siphoviridae sp. ctiOl67]